MVIFMKHIRKDIILIVVWTLCISLLASVYIDREKELLKKLVLILLVIILVLLHIKNVSRTKYFTLANDVLIIRQMFSKQKQYSLKDVSGWTENHYELLGFKTGREIILKTKEGTKIYLFKRNSKDFEKLSDYLNDNIPDAFESSGNKLFRKL